MGETQSQSRVILTSLKKYFHGSHVANLIFVKSVAELAPQLPTALVPAWHWSYLRCPSSCNENYHGWILNMVTPIQSTVYGCLIAMCVKSGSDPNIRNCTTYGTGIFYTKWYIWLNFCQYITYDNSQVHRVCVIDTTSSESIHCQGDVNVWTVEKAIIDVGGQSGIQITYSPII